MFSVKNATALVLIQILKVFWQCFFLKRGGLEAFDHWCFCVKCSYLDKLSMLIVQKFKSSKVQKYCSLDKF